MIQQGKVKMYTYEFFLDLPTAGKRIIISSSIGQSDQDKMKSSMKTFVFKSFQDVFGIFFGRADRRGQK